MSTLIAAPTEISQVNADESALILTSGPETQSNHEFAGWFGQMQFEGWQNFQSAPMPARTDEAWRFASIKSLDLSGYTRPQPISEEAAEKIIVRSKNLEKSAGRMIFANDRLLHREALCEELKSKGVIWTTIEHAAKDHEELFRKHFMTQEVVLGSRKFAALHRAMVRAGTFLYVPRGVEISLPIETHHWLHGANSSAFPHTLVIADEQSKVTMVDYFESTDPGAPGFACGVNDLHVAAGAELNYIAVQNWSTKALSIQMNSTVAGRDARAVNMVLNLGSFYARSESVSRLKGRGGRSDMLSVSVANQNQEFDQRTLQDHQQPDTASDLLYKNSLDDNARTIFAGLIRVEPHAHRTDAYQKVRNLLLSDDCEANSMPGLEILADEVRCTHGATSGQIEEEELFYLLSRGISKKVAQQLIVFGFLNEVIERLKSEPIQDRLRDLVHAKFAQSRASAV
jgi:Fe-S cluster assembly protein SufD